MYNNDNETTKAFNLDMLLKYRAEHFDIDLTETQHEAILDYLLDIDVSLSTNFDDFLVNGLSFIDTEELNQYRDDCFVLYEDEEEAIVLW